MFASSLAGFLKKGFDRAEGFMCLLTLAYALGGAALAASIGQTPNFQPLLYSKLFCQVTLIMAVVFLVARIFYIMIAKRPARLAAFIAQDFRNTWIDNGRLARALPVFICFTVFISVFTSLKSMLPAVHPFAWDRTLAKWDRVLHGGVDPWRLLQPLLGHPPATAAINLAYNSWFVVMFTLVYWQLLAVRRPRLRLRFFLGFILTWIINGTVLAMVFSSAGPCYYHAVTGDGYFDPLMDYLRRTSASGWFTPSLATQDMLWRQYKESGVGPGVGISAMPSVHVSAAFIFMMVGWNVSRAAGILLSVFFLLIMLGSVHLGWHYAIDGYAGCAVAALAWWGLTRLLGRDLPVAVVDDGVGEPGAGQVGVV